VRLSQSKKEYRIYQKAITFSQLSFITTFQGEDKQELIGDAADTFLKRLATKDTT